MGELGVLGEAVGGDAQRAKEVFAEEFAGMDVQVFLHVSGSR